MYRFGKRSKTQLGTCDRDLQEILNEAIKLVDFTVLEGHRNKELQNKYFDLGKSKLKYPQGKHNTYPSLAADVAPYPINWKNSKRFIALVYVIKGIAFQMGIKIRLGADWNGDNIFNESFQDLPHIELHSKLINGVWTKY